MTTALAAINLKRARTLSTEAAFLWASRGFVAASSSVTFDALARVDERLSKFLSALTKRPDVAERLLRHQEAPSTSGHAFVTTVVALRIRATDVFEELVTQLESEVELLLPLSSALAWLEYDEVRSQLQRLLASPAPSVVRLGILGAVAHRVRPKVTLERALDSKDPGLRGSALEAVGRLGAADLQPRLRTALEDEDATCRFWSAWSLVRFGDEIGIPALGRFAADGGAFAKPACDIAFRALEPARAVRAHSRLLSMTGSKRLGLLTAGIIGDPTLADSVLNEMESPSLARPAGAAFCLMTGRDLRRDDLDGARPADVEPPEVKPANASDSDSAERQASPALDPDAIADDIDDDLAWPDALRLRKWWDQNRRAFVRGVRYLAGVPIRPAELMNVMRNGNQQQRAAAALELALLNPDKLLVDVTLPAHRQVGTRDYGVS
jgi:uncharacterized protein (TIGR02270 family)